MQKASSTRSSIRYIPVNLNVSIVPEIPLYFSGSYNFHTNYASWSKPLLPIVSEWYWNTPITGAVTGCSGICTTKIRAPALLARHCDWHITYKNFSAPSTTIQVVYGSQLRSYTGQTETLDFQTYLNGNEVAKTCAGPVNSTHCRLQSAIAEYEIQISDNVITLKDPSNPTLIAWANNTAVTNATISKYGLQDAGTPWINTTLAGIVNAFTFQYAFTGSTRPSNNTQHRPVIQPTGQDWFTYQEATNYGQVSDSTDCTYAWKDPRTTVMAGLNSLMFRIGVHLAKDYNATSLQSRLDDGVHINSTASGSQEDHHAVFKSDFAYYYPAAALDLVTIILVASTYFRYWRLSLSVSFSPLEIAKVFQLSL